MTGFELGVIGALFAGVAAGGYLMGRRRAEPGTTGSLAGPTATLAGPSATAEKRTAEATSPEPPVAGPAAAADVAQKASVANAPEAPEAPEAEAEIPNVGEDEGGDIDVTKIGTAASAPPLAIKRTIYQPPVERIIFDPEADADELSHAESMFLVHATAQTDTGLRRKRNEDSLLVLESASVFVVADGMGGYRGGELASQLAVKSIGAAAAANAYEGPPHDGLPREASELARAIQMANADILELATRKPELKGMGTTVCAARFSPTKRRLHIAHVGDSRCYRLRDGVFKVMTADHTMASQGVNGPESVHLSRAVGIWPTIPIDVVLAVPQLGDAYLLCSDGLTKMLTDNVIGNVLRAEEDPEAAVARLVFFANSKGGKDNITVVLVRVVPPDWKPRSSSTSDADAEAKG